MYSARVLALLLAATVSLVVALALLLINGLDILSVIISAGTSFAVSFLLTFMTLEYLFFKEVNKIYKMMDKLRRIKPGQPTNLTSSQINPLKKLKEEIRALADIKQMEIDQLKKLEAFRTEFIADVSHELKTPIFAAQGFVHTLLDGAIEDKNVRTKFLRKAAKSLDGLDALVQDLLTLSQIESGDIKMKFENIDLYYLCHEVLEQFEQRGKVRGIDIIINKPSQLIMVNADWLRITQVMSNLVSNAIKYNRENGKVIIRFEVDDSSVTTFVTDNGDGIPASHFERIFERFYRVEKSRSREKGGTGLGLAIVKHILEGHNSKAEVQSTPGLGSTFSFTLPLVKLRPSVSKA